MKVPTATLLLHDRIIARTWSGVIGSALASTTTVSTPIESGLMAVTFRGGTPSDLTAQFREYEPEICANLGVRMDNIVAVSLGAADRWAAVIPLQGHPAVWLERDLWNAIEAGHIWAGGFVDLAMVRKRVATLASSIGLPTASEALAGPRRVVFASADGRPAGDCDLTRCALRSILEARPIDAVMREELGQVAELVQG